MESKTAAGAHIKKTQVHTYDVHTVAERFIALRSSHKESQHAPMFIFYMFIYSIIQGGTVIKRKEMGFIIKYSIYPSLRQFMGKYQLFNGRLN